MEKDTANNQGDNNETVTVDDVEGRVRAEMKEIEGRAKERAGHGMQDEELEREGRELQQEGKQELEEELGKQ